jgi:hypothetical protein
MNKHYTFALLIQFYFNELAGLGVVFESNDFPAAPAAGFPLAPITTAAPQHNPFPA